MPNSPSMWTALSQQHIGYLLPEGILTLGLLVVLCLTMMTYKKAREENSALMLTALVFVLGAFAALLWNFNHDPLGQPQSVMSGMLTEDLFGYLMRMLILLGTGITIGISHR